MILPSETTKDVKENPITNPSLALVAMGFLNNNGSGFPSIIKARIKPIKRGRHLNNKSSKVLASKELNDIHSDNKDKNIPNISPLSKAIGGGVRAS
ncbi:MAG: hypothetical protein HC784_09820 [Hydrococcus sp. CSU_1_8]|nr:hypothetical protein [Hydrococcus sp. CSU_1_8]